MNASLGAKKPKNDDELLIDEGEQESKVILDFNYTLEIQLDPYSIMKKVIMKKVINASAMPPDERDVEKSASKNSPKSAVSYSHQEGALNDNIYTNTMPSSLIQITSIDGFFNRKRGRPPKNRVIEVYKNTFQKPDAIFTSFKLEKQGQGDAPASYANSTDNCLQNRVEASSSYDSVMHHAIEFSRQKPTNKCSTKRIRESSVNRVLTTPGLNKFKDHQNRSCVENLNFIKANDEDNNINYFDSNKNYDLSLDHCTNTTQTKTSIIHDIGHKQNPTCFVTSPAYKKEKLCETEENVTVVRAVGTFYPECSNSNGISDSKNSKNSADSVVKEQSIFSREMEAAQNASLKNATQINAAVSLRDSTPPSTAGCSRAVLLQNYNLSQMQQHLSGCYQLLSFMIPTFSPLDLETFLTAGSSTKLMTVTGSDIYLLEYKNLLSIILNLQKQLQRNQNSCSGLASGKEADSCMRQLLKEGTITKDDQCPQNTAAPLNVSAKVHRAAVRKVRRREFQYGRECTPTGYMRYRVHQDCGYKRCSFRQHQSHFHCNRSDCLYSFCDRLRFLKHTAKHERLDIIVGKDFKQYRAKMNCNYTNCPYSFKATEVLNETFHSRNSSHFHCLLCPFFCTDSNKVVAHRRSHSKMEFLRLAGFRRVSVNENCTISNNRFDVNKDQQHTNNVMSPDNLSGSTLQQLNTTSHQQPTFDTVRHCPYVMRYTHYHCLVCNCNVLSKSQLLTHKHRNSVVSHSASGVLEAAKLSP